MRDVVANFDLGIPARLQCPKRYNQLVLGPLSVQFTGGAIFGRSPGQRSMNSG